MTLWKPPARYAKLVDFVHGYLWVQLIDGGVGPFFLNGVQRRYLELKDKHLAAGGKPRFLLLKARRTGLSTIVQAENYFDVHDAPNRHVATLAHTKEDTDAIFRIPQTFHRHAGPLIGGEHRANKREMLFHDGQSSFYTGTAGSKGFGRGATLHRVHLSEMAHYPGKIEDQRNLLAGASEAARQGEVIAETTANGAAGLFFELWEASKAGLNDWCRIFIPWWWDEKNALDLTAEEAVYVEETLTDDERALFDRVALTEGVVLTPNHFAWRRAMIREQGALFWQENPEDDVSAFLRSGLCYFDRGALELIRTNATEPAARKRLGAGDWLEWAPPEKGRRYIVGADTSEGVPGGDFSAAYVIDFHTGHVVGALHGLWKPFEFGDILAKIGERYNWATLAPEVNNHGRAVLDRLTDVVRYPTACIYRREELDTITRRPTRKLGWLTNSSTRDPMLATLGQVVVEGQCTIPDREFAKEGFAFVRVKDDVDKYAAGPGAHDDRVIALAIAHQARQHAPARPRMVRL